VSFEALCINTGAILAYSSADEYGGETFGSAGTSFKCRFDPQDGKRVVVGLNGENTVIDGFVYIPASVSVNEKDRIQVDSVTYRIISLKLQNDSVGPNHYKAAVRRAA